MRKMAADDIGMGAEAIAMRSAVDAILEDLRDRRFLKWLFDANPENCSGPVGYVDSVIDLHMQHEMVTKWVEIAWRAKP